MKIALSGPGLAGSTAAMLLAEQRTAMKWCCSTATSSRG